ncbi:hypothetical protein H0H93_013425 [Arthromyces matolae]|nr:hypothetical protein H0H93_013425 [Arthromyces matolae]
MPTNASNTSTTLADSLAALSKAAHDALAEAENRGRQDVLRANSDAREARIERDKAIEALHAAQLDAQELQKEIANAKATVSYQKETIAQLRREATQWKDQSRNWQEHFLRVEQERCSLTTRVEELVAERLQLNRSLPTPFTPGHPVLNDGVAVTMSKLRRASTSSRKLPLSPDVDSLPTSSSEDLKQHRRLTKTSRRNDSTPASHDALPITQNSLTHRTRQHTPQSPTRPPSRITVIRRVHAVVDVKREDSDEEAEQILNESTSSAPTPKRPPRKRKATMHQNEDYPSEAESDRLQSDSERTSEYDEHEEAVDDEDDELMLGGENNDDVRGRPSRTTQSISTSASKKRKVNAYTSRDKSTVRRKNQ